MTTKRSWHHRVSRIYLFIWLIATLLAAIITHNTNTLNVYPSFVSPILQLCFFQVSGYLSEPLATANGVSHIFWYFVLLFSSSLRYFLISLVIFFFFDHDSFRNVLFTFQLFGDFPNALLLLLPNLIPLRLESILGMVLVVFNLLRPFFFFYSLAHGLAQESYMCLKRMWILLLHGTFYT